MSEDTGRRGPRIFMDWVENGQGWDGGEGAHGVAEGAYAAGQAKKESVKRSMGRRFTESTEEHALHVSGSIYRAIAQTVCLADIAVLLMMVSCLPAFGSTDNPANDEMAGRCLKDGLSETGAVNTVAGIILDCQVLNISDEFVVLFLSAVNVIAPMCRKSGNGSGGRADQGGRRGYKRDKEGDIVLEQVARLLVPFILISGLYVVFNGHLSPGGGFSGGTVTGVGLILYVDVFGYRRIHRLFSFRTFTVVNDNALMVHVLLRGYSFSMRANHLESGIPLRKPGNILSTEPILPLNICVGLVVAGAMYCSCSLFQEGEVR